MIEINSTQIKAMQSEIHEILQWLDWTTEVATRIEARLQQIQASAVQVEAGTLASEQPGEEHTMLLADGVIAFNVTNFQQAIDIAGRAFWKRYGQAPTHVALPSGVDPTSLKLWTLRIADCPAPGGVVIVGREPMKIHK